MKTNKKMKIGCISVAITFLLLLPTVTAGDLEGEGSVVQKTFFFDNGGGITGDDVEFITPDTTIGDDGTGTISIDPSAMPNPGEMINFLYDDPSMQEKCGETGSVDGEIYADAYSWVHTYAEPPEDDNLRIAQSIYAEVYLEENREEHDPYIIAPTMSLYILGEGWRQGPILAAILVGEDYTTDNPIPLGKYGVAVPAAEDTIRPFRITMYLYDYVGDGDFEYSENESDEGLWYIDTNNPGIDGISVQVHEEMLMQVQSEGETVEGGSTDGCTTI